MTASALQPSPPAPYATTTLERNLAALDRADPPLAERIRLPVDGSRVSFDANGTASYRVHRTYAPLAVDREEVARRLRALGEPAAVLLLGIGTGELLDGLLGRGVPRVVVWERDPWLLRLELSRRDRSTEILRGRLRFALGTDLLDLDPEAFATVEHPLAALLYAREMRLFRRGGQEPRAALCAGGLFVDALGKALGRRGFAPWTLEIETLSLEEMRLALRRLRPRFLAAINYTGGLARLAHEYGLPLVVWEVDPATTPPGPGEGPTGHVHVFTYRRANVALYRSAGFENVEYLPLAADPELRTEFDPEAEHAVSFVGSSQVSAAAGLRRRFLALWCRWRGRKAAPEGAELLAELLAEQRRDLGSYRTPELLAARAPDLVRACRAGELGDEDPAILVAETGSSERRLAQLALLGRFGPDVWGDPGWRAVESNGVRYRGQAGHGQALTRIYNDSRINLDIGRAYQRDIVTMRVFDVLSCGRFVLAEHCPALAELFRVGEEVESYTTPTELAAKVEHFLAHPDEARTIARRGRQAVRERHTIDMRVERMLAVAGLL